MGEMQPLNQGQVGSTQLVLSDHDVYIGQSDLAERPWWSSMTLFLTVGLVTFFLWAAYFEIDQSVRASGQMIPTARNQVVQVVDGGVLARLFVEEGQQVAQGQRLAILEKERAEASLEEGRARVAGFKIALARAQAEAQQVPPTFDEPDYLYPTFIQSQQKLYEQKRRALEEKLALLESNLVLAQEQLTINEDLYANRDVSMLDVMNAKARVTDAQNLVLDAKNEYLREALEESAKLETELAMAEQRAKELLDVYAHTDVRAPVAGIVKYLKISTLGGVMRPGDELMQISPTESELLVEVKIKPMDIGQLELGLPVDISLDAFDSTIYGKLSGELIYLSSDTLTQQAEDGSSATYYRARARVDLQAKAADPKFADLVLKPGMTATVDIRTAKRTVLQFIAKPILRAFSGALTQR